jgi:hypothetical protein
MSRKKATAPRLGGRGAATIKQTPLQEAVANLTRPLPTGQEPGFWDLEIICGWLVVPVFRKNYEQLKKLHNRLIDLTRADDS